MFRANAEGSKGDPEWERINGVQITQQSGESLGQVYATVRGPGLLVERQPLEIAAEVQTGKRWRLGELVVQAPNEDDPSPTVDLDLEFYWDGAYRHVIWRWPIGRRGTKNHVDTNISPQPSEYR